MAYPPHSRTLSLAVFLLLFPFSRVCPLTVLCRSLLFCSYLGDRRSFQRDVARPVRAALSSEGDGRATVEGLAELEKLHKQARVSTAFVNDVFFPFCSSFDTMHDLFISVSSLRLYGSVLLAFLLVWRQCLGASHFIPPPVPRTSDKTEQVLPFILRREKREVLADLPPKIITEIMCDLTPEQRRLHKTWERGGMNRSQQTLKQFRERSPTILLAVYLKVSLG